MSGNQLDLNHLWNQVQELSAILQQNREQQIGLVQKADQLRARVGNSGTLVDPNGEVRTSARESELEREVIRLREENARLKHDYSESETLIEEYNAALAMIIEKIRTFSYEHTMAIINIHKSYNAQLAIERQTSCDLRNEHFEWQGRLVNLGRILRDAYHNATTGDHETDVLIHSLRSENANLRRICGWPEIDDDGNVVWQPEPGNELPAWMNDDNTNEQSAEANARTSGTSETGAGDAGAGQEENSNVAVEGEKL